MKKYLFALATVTLGLSASASPFSVASKTKLHPELCPDFTPAQVSATPAELAASRAAENEIDFMPAAGPAQALSFNGQTLGMQFAMALQIDPEFVSALTDGKITAISFYTGSQVNESVNKLTKATVFVTNDLTQRKFPFSQTVEDITSEAFAKVTVPLDSAIAIDPTKEVYVGVYYSLSDVNACPIVIDYTSHLDEYGGWVAYRSNSLGNWSWDNIASAYGFVTVGATIESTTFPQNSISLDMLGGQPVVKANEPFGFSFGMTNKGVNTPSKITIEYGIDGEASVTDEVNVDGVWGINQTLTASINNYVASKASKGSNLSLKITKVDGVDNASSQNARTYSLVVVPTESNLPRNVVIEEFTSTSCVYCPVGITAMERIRETFTDGSIVPVAVHVNTPSTDPMTSSTYRVVYNNFGPGSVPSAVLNRAYAVYPQYEDLVDYAINIRMLPGVAFVDGEATLNADTRELTINTKTSFAFDYSDGDQFFALAYGITENNVGPYTQSNGYAGSGMNVDGGWQNKPSRVSLVYNDVARQLNTINGIKGTVPSEIKAGEVYENTYKMDIIQAVGDLNNINVVVYLLNLKTLEVENVCLLKDKGNGTFESGITNITVDDSNAPVEYYNLQGVRVDNPAAGLYIRRQGNNVTKTIIR